MRSPFGVFRKQQKLLMAGLVILCMFAFTLADFLQPQHFPTLLGMIAFGLIFYLLGQPTGKGGWYALAGVILGFAVVSLVPQFWGPDPAATSTVGTLSEEELREKLEQRRRANQFILQVYQSGFGARPDIQSEISREMARIGDISSFPENLREMFMNSIIQQASQRLQMWERGFQNFAFAPLEERLESAREATVREWVMAEQADELGIEVSNAAITEYLQKASGGRLSREQFTEFRKDMGLSEAELYDLLRYHIKARQYLILTFPQAMTPPQKQWEFYKRATVKQTMELAKIPVSAFTDQIADPSDAELSTFYDQYKNRQPPGIITRTEGWTEPVEILSPEPAFAVPRRIKLAYLTARIPDYKPTDQEIAEHFEKNIEDYPNPAYSRPLEDIPRPQTPGGPAIAQPSTRGKTLPAWAEKREHLTLEQAKGQVRSDLVYAHQQRIREQNDKLISQAMTLMNDLSLARLAEGDKQKSPQEISDELKAFAQDNGLEYTVPESAWTAKEMTATKVGQAMEVDIRSNPLPGQVQAAVLPGGANVVYLTFIGSTEEELYRPNQAISPDEVDTRYAYWKIEDHPPASPEWGDLSEDRRQEVAHAWKIQKARDLANQRAIALKDKLKEALAKEPKETQEGETPAPPKDLQTVLDEMNATITGKEGGKEIVVAIAPAVQWMQDPDPQTGLRFGTVPGAPKAGEKFMEAAFHDLEEPGDLAVLVNADATVYFVAKLVDREYGEGKSLESLREAFLSQAGTPAMQLVSELVYQQNQEVFQKWRQQFDEKFKINVAEVEAPLE